MLTSVANPRHDGKYPKLSRSVDGAGGKAHRTLEILARALAARAGPLRGRRAVITDGDTATILAMPLGQFARGDRLVEIRVPWLDVTVWFVPEERDAEALGREGVHRGRVWTAGELLATMVFLERASVTVQTLALTKHAIDGEIVGVRPLSGRAEPSIAVRGEQ